MIYEKLVRPILFKTDPEKAHGRALTALGALSKTPIVNGVIKNFCTVRDPRLEQKLFGITFENPVGLAAGMDKQGLHLPAWEMLGFGFAEVGGFTWNEQLGNPTPRLFRLPEDRALINRMGLNNPGANRAQANLSSFWKYEIPFGINIGKSKDAPVEDLEAVADDYRNTFDRLSISGASFFVVNVSSPNTPGLRSLLAKEPLTHILKALREKNLRMPRCPGERTKPMLLKISPDLEDEQFDDIIAIIKENPDLLDGLVAINTTTNRAGLKTTGQLAQETGGLSGAPIRTRALEVVRYFRNKLPTMPIIGVGGISTGMEAFHMLCAGANMVQLYTALVYEGPLLIRRINTELLRIMKNEGLSFPTLHPDTNRN